MKDKHKLKEYCIKQRIIVSEIVDSKIKVIRCSEDCALRLAHSNVHFPSLETLEQSLRVSLHKTDCTGGNVGNLRDTRVKLVASAFQIILRGSKPTWHSVYRMSKKISSS